MSFGNSHPHILVVDDEVFDRTTLSSRLGAEGFKITAVESGEKALDTLRLARFDAILLDLGMPGIDGYETLQRIKADVLLKRIPVFMLIGITERQSAQRCIQLGAIDYLLKPFNIPTIKDSLNNALNAGQALASSPLGQSDGGKIVSARILIVDDNEMNRDVLNKRLKRLGATHISMASGGRDALNMLNRETFDLVMLDIMMPDVDGFQVLENIRKNERMRRMAVIMISANDDKETVKRCMGLGANDYIVKPFNPDQVKHRIEECLSK